MIETMQSWAQHSPINMKRHTREVHRVIFQGLALPKLIYKYLHP
jgi:hypothetical protein